MKIFTLNFFHFQLINQNAAIIDMPKADAPRPKRMSRQNSEISVAITRSHSDVGLIGSPASILPGTPYVLAGRSAPGPSPLAATPVYQTGQSPPSAQATPTKGRIFLSIPNKLAII